nr:thioesterase family protein [Paenibacillus rhizolycopersici]
MPQNHHAIDWRETRKGANRVYVCEVVIEPKYSEFDMMGIIYHAHYLEWFELGRLQLSRNLGFDYVKMEQAGYISPVHEMKVEYKRGIRYGETVLLKTRVIENSGVKTAYGYEVYNGEGTLCVEGSSSHYVVRRENFKPVQFKKVFPEWYAALEEARKS